MAHWSEPMTKLPSFQRRETSRLRFPWYGPRAMSRPTGSRRLAICLLFAGVVGVAGLGAPSARADEAPPALPDKTGAFQTVPTAYSVPGYTKPDPEKTTVKDVAVAVDAVAQSASHGIYSANFVWTLI